MEVPNQSEIQQTVFKFLRCRSWTDMGLVVSHVQKFLDSYYPSDWVHSCVSLDGRLQLSPDFMEARVLLPFLCSHPQCTIDRAHGI